ncbi:MAG: DHH family phosphoesterase [Lachnospiraceae bacterium]|uniref:DHH family phosphoesterase n=1 Tax=uncultured Acetatifactor sp. TaxID=1671927 RepID=UPI0026F3DB18|nr:DHH family phosphoesterase [uncultured Acetatifactor sp.]MCI8790075.1 DHH family phosphoesterase [Lachnospiraceae bacterium]
MNDIKTLAGLCQGSPVYIQTHDFPDPDAIASAYGLQKLLANYGVESVLCYDGKIDKLSASKMLDAFRIAMSSYKCLVEGMRETDRIICVDTQKHGGNVTDFVGEEIACIDHHPTFVPAEYRYQDIRITGACATLVAEYYALSGIEPDKDTATALLYGMKMDTLQFTRGVTELDIRMFGYLFPRCDQEKLSDLERNNMEFNDLKAYGAAIENIELYDRVGFSTIPFPCPDALVAVISDFILSLVEVEVAVVSSFRKNGVKLSVRSEIPEIHAGNLLHRALQGIGDGGGHASMGGGFISKERLPEPGRYQEDYIRNLFLDALAEEGDRRKR